MQGCISIFKRLLLICSLVLAGAQSMALAQEAGPPKEKKAQDETSGDEAISGPFSEYGEFDSAEDEAADERFFQYGRFFGIGLSAGLTTATGNAGKLYQGGFPTAGLRLMYWFDFQFALQMEVQNSKHNYDQRPHGRSDVNLFRIMFDVKYYFDTRDLSAPITFVGPHLIAGAGFYQRTDNIGSGSNDPTVSNTTNSVNAFGFNFGGGFELTLKPKKVYLQLESLIHMVQFSDQLDSTFKDAGIPDRTGNWITASVALVWTW